MNNKSDNTFNRVAQETAIKKRFHKLKTLYFKKVGQALENYPVYQINPKMPANIGNHLEVSQPEIANIVNDAFDKLIAQVGQDMFGKVKLTDQEKVAVMKEIINNSYNKQIADNINSILEKVIKNSSIFFTKMPLRISEVNFNYTEETVKEAVDRVANNIEASCLSPKLKLYAQIALNSATVGSFDKDVMKYIKEIEKARSELANTLNFEAKNHSNKEVSFNPQTLEELKNNLLVLNEVSHHIKKSAIESNVQDLLNQLQEVEMVRKNVSSNNSKMPETKNHEVNFNNEKFLNQAVRDGMNNVLYPNQAKKNLYSEGVRAKNSSMTNGWHSGK